MSNPKIRSQRQIVVTPDSDAFHFVDIKGNIVGWIDGTGSLQGNLTTNAGTTTDNIQGNPISSVLPKPNQVLGWDGTSWFPTTIVNQNNNFADNEIPVGAIDGCNTIFMIENFPNPPSSVKVYYNSGRQDPAQYSVTGNTLQLTFTPQIGDTLVVDYRY
jgi:hypothetical protein